MLRFLKHICFLLLIVFLTSCISRNVVEDIGLITVRGFDFIDQKVEVTGGMYEFTTDGSQNSTFSGRANTLKGAIDNANRKTSYKLEYGKVQLDLFHKEFAKKGLYPYLDSLGRDAVEPDEMYIAISKEPTKEIITKKKEEMKSVNTDIGQHLHELIKRSSRNDVFPKISYSMFLSNVSDTGKEAILPIFELLEGTPAITSMAVFKDDQYVGEIDITNRIYYALFQKKLKMKN